MKDLPYSLSFFLLIVSVLSGAVPVLGVNLTGDNIDAIHLYNSAVDKAMAGEFDQAVHLTDQALAIQPNFTLAQITRAGALMELGRMDEAGQTLKTALAMTTEHPSLLTSVASYYLKTADYNQAISYADLAINHNPSQVEAWIIKGTAHGELGEYQEEYAASEQALAIEPENSLALSNKEYAMHHLNSTGDKKTPISILSPVGAFLVLALIIAKKNE